MASVYQDHIFLLGDSLTQGGWESNGFAQKLAYVYARKFDVINRGLSGYNTEWAIPCFEQCLVKREHLDDHPNIRMLLIWFGANDACIRPSPQHVPLEQFEANLSKLIGLVKSSDSPYYSPKTHIILLTPPPINTYQREAELTSRNPPLALDRKFEVTKEYAESVKKVARAEGLLLVDIWKTVWDKVGQDEKSLSKYLRDGLHFNSEGYEIVYEEIIRVITDSLPHLHYEKLQPVFPPWDQVDWKDPRPSLNARNPEKD